MSKLKIVLKTKDGVKQKLISKDKPIGEQGKTGPDSMLPVPQKGLPQEEIGWQSLHVHKGSIDEENRLTWSNSKPMVFSIIGAIFIGVILGFSILSLFVHPPDPGKNSIDSHLSMQPVHSDHQKKVQAISTFIIQAGHYNHRMGAQKAMKNLHTRGLSAVVSGDAKPYRIFLAVAVNQQQAKKLAQTYQQKGVRVFVKQWKFPELQTQCSPQALQLIQQGHKLFLNLTARSVEHLAQKQPATIYFSTERSNYQSWVRTFQNQTTQLKDWEKTVLLEMIRALDLAVQSGNEVEKHPSDPLLLQMQEGLVRYIMAYKSLVEMTS